MWASEHGWSGTRYGNYFLSPVLQFIHSKEECKRAAGPIIPAEWKPRRKLIFLLFFKLFLNVGRLGRSSHFHMWQEQSFLFSLTNVFPGFALLLSFPALKLTGLLCRTAYSLWLSCMWLLLNKFCSLNSKGFLIHAPACTSSTQGLGQAENQMSFS